MPAGQAELLRGHRARLVEAALLGQGVDAAVSAPSPDRVTVTMEWTDAQRVYGVGR